MTYIRSSDTLLALTSPMEDVFQTRDDNLNGSFHAVAMVMMKYLHETLSILALYALPDMHLMAWPRLSMARDENASISRPFGLLPQQLPTFLSVPISSFSGISVTTLDGEGVCATEVQGTVSLSGLDARLF